MPIDTPQPTSTVRAALCLWVSAVLAVFATVLQVIDVVPIAAGTVGATAAIGTITAALLAFMAAKVSAGRGWVRWLFTILYAFGTLGSVLAAFVAPEAFRALPTLLQINAAIQAILQTVALVLMFTPASRAWFNATHVRAAS